MSKLDPRPESQKPKYSWDELNIMLQNTFTDPSKKSLLIDLRQFKISKEDIIPEAEKQGYKVSEEKEHYLRFK
ncbi:hypothetical protein [Virgibacillus sp. YIM 98842]|uniref:hypothetical protein n=1 Tax=Virgibacillus sp. YIM 98842 TaxID=2663533 RepID=UPI0013DAB5BE|nr:hypothetical protein [Virgibacillus sp. YIM 98842]